MTEKETQAAVKKLYRDAGAIVYDTSQPRRAQITPGVPDLIVFLTWRGKGYMFFHEVKTSAGRQSSAQKGFQDSCDRAGETYLLGGVPEGIDHLRTLGVLG